MTKLITQKSNIYLLIAFATLLFNSSTIFAIPIYSVDSSNTVYIGASAARIFNYDSTAQNLSSNISNTFLTDQSGPFIVPAGLQSNMQLDANIDNAGNLITGTVTFLGGGVGGIALNTILMTGNIIDFSYVLTPADEITNFPNPSLIPAFEFIVEVTDSLAAFAFSDLLDFRYRYSPSSAVMDPFLSDFTGTAFTGENIFTANLISAVPEPSILLLFLGGLISLFGFQQRKKHN